MMNILFNNQKIAIFLVLYREKPLSGSLKDTQAVQSHTESVGDKYPQFDKLLGRHEGGYDDFNVKNGSKYAAHRGEEIADGKKLSDLTVGEVMQMQKNGELFAAGHYQITPLAMKDAVRLAGVSPDEQFSPEIQDKLFEDGLLKKAGAGKLYDYITGKSDDIDKAMLATAQEWAAFPVPHDMHVSDKFGERDLKAGDSYYEGVKGNHSNMSLEDAKAAIEEMRANYLAAHSENNQTESTAKSAENLTVESVNQSDNQVSGSLKDNGQPEKHSQNNQTTQTADNVIKSATPISGQSENTTETVKVADTQMNRLKDNWEYKKGYDNSSDKPANSVEKTPNRFLRRISYREIEGRKFDCSNPVEREESFKASPFCSELRSAAKKMIDDKALYTGERSYENAAKYIFNPNPFKYVAGLERDFLNDKNGYHRSMGQCFNNEEADPQYTLAAWAINTQPFYGTINGAEHAYFTYSMARGAVNTINAAGHLWDKGKFDDGFFKLAFNTNMDDMANVRGLEIGKLAAHKKYGYRFDKFVDELCGKEK